MSLRLPPIGDQKLWKRVIPLHLGLGLAFSVSRAFPAMFAVGVVIVGLIVIEETKNRKGEAHLFAAYLVSLEILMRMSKAMLFHEFTKYAVVLLLCVGMIAERKTRKGSGPLVLYFIFLLPGIFLTDAAMIALPWRQIISANLSGPLCLCVAGVYFYRRRMTVQEMVALCYVMILPMFASAAFIVRHISGLEQVYFGTTSNKYITGGFGPNQVSAAFGMGVLVALIPQFVNRSLLPRKWHDRVVAALFLGFGLISFSRGGIVTAAFSLAAAVAAARTRIRLKPAARIGFVILAAVIFLVVWRVVDGFTAGMLEQRWQKEFSGPERMTFTGRRTIAQMDIYIFQKHLPFGAGVGMSQAYHVLYGHRFGLENPSPAASHTEYTRMLAEHGLLGIAAIVMMLIVIIGRMRGIQGSPRAPFFFGFMVLSLLTMTHTATRIAMPSFFFGLALVDLLADPAVLRPVRKAPATAAGPAVLSRAG